MDNRTDHWSGLLKQAVTEPGAVLAAYSNFHNYSFGNMLWAWAQCSNRGIALGPINTYKGWQSLGRQVRRGEKAIELCMPVVGKKKAEEEGGEDKHYRRFIFRRNWFVLAQTDGEPYQMPALPGWDKARALAALDVTEIPFETLNGNTQGYAVFGERKLAINPVAALPHKTLFHELGHIVLGHTEHREDPRDIREAEAEAVALLMLDALGLPGAEYCRGYVQNWLGAGREIPDKSAQKILNAANQILQAGREAQSKEEGERAAA